MIYVKEENVGYDLIKTSHLSLWSAFMLVNKGGGGREREMRVWKKNMDDSPYYLPSINSSAFPEDETLHRQDLRTHTHAHTQTRTLLSLKYMHFMLYFKNY